MNQAAELERHIAALRKRLEAAEYIKEAMAADPELVRVLGLTVAPERVAEKPTHNGAASKKDKSLPAEGKAPNSSFNREFARSAVLRSL